MDSHARQEQREDRQGGEDPKLRGPSGGLVADYFGHHPYA
jgi:hypothetical protein